MEVREEIGEDCWTYGATVIVPRPLVGASGTIRSRCKKEELARYVSFILYVCAHTRLTV